MCGLTGFLNAGRNQSSNEMVSIVSKMAESLHHRGPDDAGSWCDQVTGIGLGFRRLSIVDLSPSGHQPMISACGRFVIVYNGEVYNPDELREELTANGHRFRGHSDTEVLVEGFSEWGIELTIRRALGMFAIAVWDTQRREITLIRDRLGKKPLYYGKFGTTFLFGSELKALRAHPAFKGTIDRNAIAEFLQQSYLTERSIYQQVRSLPPGSSLTIQLDDDEFWSGTNLPEPKDFWSLQHVVRNGIEKPFTGSYRQAVDQLDELLTDAVGRRMVADVPLGAFLSGGIDSSLVVALMQKQSSRPVKTFTIGFEEEAFNEAPYAQRVARHLKTDHTELIVTSHQAQEVIPLLPILFDEPFADSSQIPTYLVSQLARRDVTVALSGDGGDELFCGYRRYFEALDGYALLGSSTMNRIAYRTLALVRRMPPVVRTAFAKSCRIAGRFPVGRLARLMSRSADLFEEKSPHDRYLRNLSHWRDLDHVVLGLSPKGRFQPFNRTVLDEIGTVLKQGLEPGMPSGTTSPSSSDSRITSDTFQQTWQAYDTLRYLPGDILTKVDRASMGVSLEARTPLLDHRVVEFAWSLPHEFKFRDRSGKRILRDVLAKYVPRELFERPKVGFGVPIGDWLRGPLRNWAESLINETRLKSEGFFNPQPIRQKWLDHLSGRADWSYHLWDIMMFQTWLAQYPVE